MVVGWDIVPNNPLLFAGSKLITGFWDDGRESPVFSNFHLGECATNRKLFGFFNAQYWTIFGKFL